MLERAALRQAPPPMHQVVMLNDDSTPMEFVVVILQEFFGKDLATATAIMQKIHFEGRGICGVASSFRKVKMFVKVLCVNELFV